MFDNNKVYCLADGEKKNEKIFGFYINGIKQRCKGYWNYKTQSYTLYYRGQKIVVESGYNPDGVSVSADHCYNTFFN